MNAIIQKLHNLNKLDITLPSSKKSIQINKINLELQSRFEDFARDVKNELTASTKYIQFITTHIKKEAKEDINYIDKLYILLQWFNDLKEEEKIDCNLTDITIPDFTVKFDTTDMIIKFELPTLVKELAFLKYILTTKKDDMKSVDVLFYFIFRFVQSINVDDDIILAESIDICEEVYKVLSMKKVTSITDHLDDAFKSIEQIRNLEVDPRVFFA
jgi:hypothetical protein